MTALEQVVLLSPAEQTRLIDLEVTIDKGMRTFVEVGKALAEIRDTGLYRDEHATFEDYCQKRWDMRREGADRFIRAAEVVAIVGTNPNGLIAPRTEALARELAPLSKMPDRLREAWAEAVSVGDGKPTARDVRDVVQQYRSKAEPQPEPTYCACPTCGQRVRADRPLRGVKS